MSSPDNVERYVRQIRNVIVGAAVLVLIAVAVVVVSWVATLSGRDPYRPSPTPTSHRLCEVNPTYAC